MNENFINNNRNDKFSSFRGIDLQELIVQIENFMLEYRTTLNLDKNVTVGMEIEYEKLNQSIVDDYVYNNNLLWDSKDDGSVSGGEITSPKCMDTIKTWHELRNICEFLKKQKATTDYKAGAHVHIGAHILGKDIKTWLNFLTIYVVYKHILFRYSFNNQISGRKYMLEYATPVADRIYQTLKLINKCKNVSELYDLLPDDKRQAINFQHVKFYDILNDKIKNTIEFRMPNGTIEEVIWQNNVNTFSKLILSSKSPTFDREFLEYKLENERVSSNNIIMYNVVCLKNALEFVDLIFDNNLDKAYFLKQYLKGFKDKYSSSNKIYYKGMIK